MQALWMLAASFFFATMSVCVKIASVWFTASELVFWRGVLGVLFLWVWARSTGVSLRTPYPMMHAWRSAIGVISLGAWFYAIAWLPLATALTLNYMSSVWIAVILIGSALVTWSPASGGSPLRQGPLAVTVLAGFAGVLLMLRPAIEQNQMFAGVVGLLSGMTAAVAYLQVMALGRAGEPDVRTVFYFALGSLVFGAVGMGVTGVSTWNWMHAAWLLPVGLLASLGQVCMTRAYSQGATLVVANLQYSGLVMGAIYGLVLFDEDVPLVAWGGMALIVASGIAATVLRSRAAPDAPAEEH